MEQLYQNNPFKKCTYTRYKSRSFTSSLESYQYGASKESLLLRWNKRLPMISVIWHLTKVFSSEEIKALRTKVFRYLKEHGIVAVASIELTCGKDGKPNNTVHFHFLTDDQRGIKEIRKLFNSACEQQGLVRRKDFWISCQALPDADRYFDYFTKRNCDDVILFSKGTGLQKFYQIGKWFKEGKGKIWKEIRAYMREKNSGDDSGRVDGKGKEGPVYAVYDPGIDGDWELPVVVSQPYDIHEILTEMDYCRLCDDWNRRTALGTIAMETAGVGS